MLTKLFAMPLAAHAIKINQADEPTAIFEESFPDSTYSAPSSEIISEQPGYTFHHTKYTSPRSRVNKRRCSPLEIMDRSDFYKQFADNFDTDTSSLWGKGRVADFMNSKDFSPDQYVREARTQVVKKVIDYENILTMPGGSYKKELLSVKDPLLSRVALEPLKSGADGSFFNMRVTAKGTGCTFYVGRVFGDSTDKEIKWHNVIAADNSEETEVNVTFAPWGSFSENTL